MRKLELNPHAGKPFRGRLSGKWSLRVGDYRIIYTIDEHKKAVILFTAKHRRVAYE